MTIGGLVVAGLAGSAQAADPGIRINEVQSNSAVDAPDFVELVNTGHAPVDISGWILRDDDDSHAVVVPPGTELAAGAFYVIEPDVDGGFGLGKADAARIYDGETLIDSYAWTEHALSEGRLPDGTGGFVDTEPTPGAPNMARATEASVTINEVESNGDARGDWVELANTDAVNTADISGWSLVDGDPDHEPMVFPPGTTIESGGYRAILTDEGENGFGLGGADSVTLRDGDGAVVSTYAWTDHAATTYGRCPDMTGPFALTGKGTFETRNDCDAIEEPDYDVSPWPFGNDVADAVAAGTWGEDMSGLDVARDGTVFAVNNDNGEIFELAEGAGPFTVAASWVPTYPDGSGQPDAEGLTVAGDGAIFLSTERDNKAGNVSRPSVLRVELGADGGSTTTHEWNLTPITGPLGANAGIEAIEWISDADATRLGLRDADGSAYSPAAFGEHFGGVFVVSVEQTGTLHVVVLGADGEISELQSTTLPDAVAVVMGLDWRAGDNELWGLCDEACSNRHAKFGFVDGELTLRDSYAPPTGMDPAFTNEGLAIQWCATDRAAVPSVLWISDTAHDGVSLRRAAGQRCDAGPGEPGGPGDAGGQDVPTPDDELTDATRGDVRAPATATRGERIDVTVGGAGGSQVAVWLHSDPVLLTSARVAGDDTVPATIPSDTPLGAHRIVVQDAAGSLVGWTDIRIVADDDGTSVSPTTPVSPAGQLPDTGNPVGLWVVGAGLALLLGGVVLLAARSPRPHLAPAAADGSH